MSEARTHRRLGELPLLVAYSIGDDYEPERTEAYDLGLGGLAMFAGSELPVAQPVRLEVELRGDPRPPLRLTGAVRWCRFDPALEKFRTGVEFIGRTAEQEAQLVGYIDTVHKLRDLGL